MSKELIDNIDVISSIIFGLVPIIFNRPLARFAVRRWNELDEKQIERLYRLSISIMGTFFVVVGILNLLRKVL